MFGFGELNFESSRACADDEEEDVTGENMFGLSVEWTEDGQKIVQGEEGSHPFVFCSFEGKVALGFGEGFLGNKENKFTLLGQVFTTGNEGTVDLCSLRPRRKPTARIFSGGGSVIFALIDFYGIPRFLANQLVDKMLPLIKQASEVVIFHSEISAYYRNEESGMGKLFYLTSSTFLERNLGNVIEKGERLKPPNVIGGPSAGILTQCERMRKPGLLLIAYVDSELVDSINLGPFLQAIVVSPKKPTIKDSGGGSGDDDKVSGFNLGKLFSKFQHNIRQVADVSNLYA